MPFDPPFHLRLKARNPEKRTPMESCILAIVRLKTAVIALPPACHSAPERYKRSILPGPHQLDEVLQPCAPPDVVRAAPQFRLARSGIRESLLAGLCAPEIPNSHPLNSAPGPPSCKAGCTPHPRS